MLKKKCCLLVVFLLCVESKIQIFVKDGPIEQIGQRFYKKELLTNDFEGPIKELSFDRFSKNLFFMYMDDEIQNSGRAYINVVTKESKKISGMKFNKATAVNTGTGEVYFGNNNGLFKYNSTANDVTNIGLYNFNIHKLVIRSNEMFLLDANNHMLYKIFGEGITAVKMSDFKTVLEFEVDNKNNVHLVNMCGVYCIVDGHETIKNKDLNMVYNFLVDNNKTYGIYERNMYEIDCRNGTANKVAAIDFSPTSITFGEHGDILYSVENNIFRLKPINSYLVYNIYKGQK